MGPVEVILAIDPGAVSGWAIVSVGPSPEHVRSGTFHFTKSPKGQPVSPTELVTYLCAEANRDGHTILRAAIEDQYLDKNVNTLKKLARNGGRWEEACEAAGIPVEYVAASTWQSRELCMPGAKRDVLRRAADAKAFGIWQLEGPEHRIDAALIGRYVAVTMYRRMIKPPPH